MPIQDESEEQELPEGESIELKDEEVSDVQDTEDGGAIITLENETQASNAREHFANIVDDVDVHALRTITVDLLEKITRDKEAREKRDKLYEEGLQRTGLGNDAPGGANFTGATRVVHPMLVEACVDFSARVMKELFPANGPVKSKVFGPQEAEKLDKAQRKAEFMNWQLTQQVVEFRGDLEQLSTQLPLGGAQYLKFVWNDIKQRAVPEFVPIDDMLLPFAATNFYSAERRTHVQYITAAEYRNRIKRGMYRDVDLPTPEDPEFSRAERANQKIEGKTPTSYNEDGLRKVFEVSTTLDIEKEGEFLPYIITIDDSTQETLGLMRNWDPEDPKQEELDYAVEFPFIPWRGSAPIGLTHLIGGLAAASTGALRALLDSAHINNVPSGVKLKGGPTGQTLNPQPGQIVEIESSGMVDDVRKIVMPLPYNQPSPVLFQLLGFLVDAGKGVIQTSFEKLADSNANAPVGTTLALIEQGMVVFSSIHSRLHSSMERCFKILHRLNSSYLTDELIKSYDCGIEIKPQDFDGPMDVVPVSDPAIFSETQRFAQVQAIQQRAAVLPQLYDARKVEAMFLRAMKVNADDVLVEEPGKENRDPVSENVAATLGQPIYVLPHQEHLEHIQLHMAFLQSPMFGQNPAIIKTFLYPMAQHLRDHVLNYYLSESHKAIRKAKEAGVPLETTDAEVGIITAVQQAAEAKLNGFAQALAEIDQDAQQYAPQPQMPPDSSLQIAQLTVQERAQSNAQRAQIEQGKLQHQMQKTQQDAQLSQAELQLKAQKDQQDDEHKDVLAHMEALKEQNRMIIEQLRQRSEDQRTAMTVESRERMNQADNQTAINIAAAEIASGEKVAVTTGTGLNP